MRRFPAALRSSANHRAKLSVDWPQLALISYTRARSDQSGKPSLNTDAPNKSEPFEPTTADHANLADWVGLPYGGLSKPPAGEVLVSK